MLKRKRDSKEPELPPLPRRSIQRSSKSPTTTLPYPSPKTVEARPSKRIKGELKTLSVKVKVILRTPELID